jgi:hypothetical protein
MSDETKPLDLDAIEARANAATPGPWRGDRHDGTAKYSVEGAPSTSGPQALVLRVDHKDGEFGFVGLNGTADEAFVLAARTDVPALVAEVRRLTADLAECYRLTGADPDGNDDAHLARKAVGAVKRLRAESDHEGEKSEEWERCYRALETAAKDAARLRLFVATYDGRCLDQPLGLSILDALDRALLAKGGGS